jgi:2-polyprenyl-6-methoxyphenol hydroxylase-like FAD-dependent oxidoreductase
MEKHVKSWKDTTMLDIFQAKVPKWSRDGLVLIGDAAHTVSPVLGQGVNLAIQDAVELAPVICDWLQKHPNKIVEREAMIPFEEKRKKDIEFVRSFQEKQENLLAGKTTLQILKRKLMMRLLDKHPLKFKVMSQIASGRRD